jgi:putative transposase
MQHYVVADNLNTESSLMALKIAVKQRKNKNLPLIHHSERGLQYCAKDYQSILNKNGILSSMKQKSDPYENAVAERINRILKQEFMIDKYYQNLDIMKSVIKEAINTYNVQYPNYKLTLEQIYLQNQIQMRTYKKKQQ